MGRGLERWKMRTGWVFGLAAAASLAGSMAMADGPIIVGEAFPDLVLPSLEDGGPMRVSDFRPKPVVLHIFASW